jgi:hypothetical protein
MTVMTVIVLLVLRTAWYLLRTGCLDLPLLTRFGHRTSVPSQFLFRLFPRLSIRSLSLPGSWLPLRRRRADYSVLSSP